MTTITEFLSNPSNVLVIDGGLGTELERRGCDLKDPLWSGKMLIEDPQKIKDVEVLYLAAGAKCIVTSSYQVTPESFHQHRGIGVEKGSDLIALSVELAKEARKEYTAAPYPGVVGEEASAPVFIAGSVGPYGAFLANGAEYTGDYPPEASTPEFFQHFHARRIQALVESGIDVLAVETQACMMEVLAVVDHVESLYPDVKMWVSFTTAAQDATRLPDGTPLSEVAPLLHAHPSVIAMGVNCVPLLTAVTSLREMSAHTTKPLIVYSHNADVFDTCAKEWKPPTSSAHTLAGHAEDWIANGARIIGGCCRTGPKDIRDLCNKLSYCKCC